MAARAMGPTGCQDGKCRANDRRSMLGQVHFPLTILTSLSTYLGQVHFPLTILISLSTYLGQVHLPLTILNLFFSGLR